MSTKASQIHAFQMTSVAASALQRGPDLTRRLCTQVPGRPPSPGRRRGGQGAHRLLELARGAVPHRVQAARQSFTNAAPTRGAKPQRCATAFMNACPSSHAAALLFLQEIRNKNNPGPAPRPPLGVTGHKPGTPGAPPGQRPPTGAQGAPQGAPLLPLPPPPPAAPRSPAGTQQELSPPPACPSRPQTRGASPGNHRAAAPAAAPRPAPAPYRCAGRSRRRRKPRTAAEGGPPGGEGRGRRLRLPAPLRPLTGGAPRGAAGFPLLLVPPPRVCRRRPASAVPAR